MNRRQPPPRPKRYTRRPCALCGWSEHMAIHSLPGAQQVVDPNKPHPYQPKGPKQ